MENFDYKNYRSNLVKKIKELTPEERPDLVKNEKETTYYKISGLVNICKKFLSTFVETYNRDSLSEKTIDIKKFTNENFFEKDISEYIHSDLQFYIDLGILEDINQLYKTDFFKKQLKESEAQKIEEVAISYDKIKLSLNQEEIKEKAYTDKEVLLDNLSVGAYLDTRNLNTVIGALDNKSETKRLRNIISFFSREIITGDRIGNLWFCSGKNHYADPMKPILIFSKENKNFTKLMEEMWRITKERFFRNNDEAVKEFLELLKIKDDYGNDSYVVSYFDAAAIIDKKTNKSFYRLFKAFNAKFDIQTTIEFGDMIPYCFINNLHMESNGSLGSFLEFHHDLESFDKKPLYEYADFIIDLPHKTLLTYKPTERGVV